ncbi:MAG: flagellar hook protein [Lachnospiraceae bacterium]|nr:flagellar hook protein [Lachnospiraceae bacterium]
MVVQHNLQAMNANRMLGVTQNTVSGSTEKLSSGYKINRAADDAAGLSISEKMRKQIRGLSKASANAEDGISSVQTAEGALQEVTDMLQRMNELVVQAANGTNSITDRQYIQDEIDQLVTEVDRVAETTKFNETYLLKGDGTKETTKVYTAKYAITYSENMGTVTKTASGGATGEVKYKIDYIGDDNLYVVKSEEMEKPGETPTSADFITKGEDVTKYLFDAKLDVNGKIENTLSYDGNYAIFKNAKLPDAGAFTYANGQITITDTDKYAFFYDTETNTITKMDSGKDLSKYLDVEINGGNMTDIAVKDRYRLVKIATENSPLLAPYNQVDNQLGTVKITTKEECEANRSMKQLFDAHGEQVSGIALNDYFDSNGKYTGGLYADSQATHAVTEVGVNGKYKLGDYITKNTAEVTADLSFSLHVGADSARTNKIETKIQSMSAASLGINKLKSTSVGIVDKAGNNATDAIDVISAALQKVSTQRSALGAVQNRLEHTIKNLDNVVENTQSAESAIRDTDMAEEMVKYSNANILLQAGQSMLAQANQSNRGVLSIL